MHAGGWPCSPGLHAQPFMLAAPQHLCSQQVVNYAHLRDRAHAFPWATLQLSRLHYALELWQVRFMRLY